MVDKSVRWQVMMTAPSRLVVQELVVTSKPILMDKELVR